MSARRSVAAAFSISFFATCGAISQEYPNRPIRIVTSGVGGNTDFASRQIAQGISAPLNQPVIVDNRGGAGVPGQTVARATPDGYTLLLATNAVWQGSLLQKLDYDPVADFSPITIVTRSILILAVHPSLPVKSVKELIALAKAKPGELSYATGAPGSGSHLAGETFNSMAGTKIVAIPYKSNQASIADLLGGRVQVAFEGQGSLVAHLKSGKLRALAVTSAQPSPLYPELPTVANALPGYETANVQGVLAPAKTPRAVIIRLNQEIRRFLDRPDAKQKFYDFGLDPTGSSPEEFAARIKSDLAQMARLLKESGVASAN